MVYEPGAPVKEIEPMSSLVDVIRIGVAALPHPFATGALKVTTSVLVIVPATVDPGTTLFDQFAASVKMPSPVLPPVHVSDVAYDDGVANGSTPATDNARPTPSSLKRDE
jgi:hypothetical protein